MARTGLFRLCSAIALSAALTGAVDAAIVFKQPTWGELSREQQHILAPLATEWNVLDADRKKKWLAIAQRYASMTPDEKLRAKSRMEEWTKLSSAERRAARDSFTALQQAPVEKREIMKETLKQQWSQYEALPESEKSRLRAEGQSKGSTTSAVPATPPGQSSAVK
jgi:hypothetical protein